MAQPIRDLRLADLRTMPLPAPEELPMLARAVFERMAQRRTVRDFAATPVPRDAIAWCLRAAGSAPSGANQQPWHFVAVADPEVKRRIRAAAEAEERAFYGGRAPDGWLAALAPLGTDADKPFLETAPWLVAVFAQNVGRDPRGDPVKHYYVAESVGIATGLLIAALHEIGLVTLTHTPSPMGFLRDILGRPADERAYLLLVVGYPAPEARVPAIARKSLDEIATFVGEESSAASPAP